MIIIKHAITLLITIFIILGAIVPVHADDMNVQREKQTREQIKNILSSNEFSGEKKQSGILKTVADMIKSIAEWINEQIKKLKIPDKSVNLTSRQLSPGEILTLKIIGILIIVLFIAAVLYFLYKNLRISRKLKQEEDALILSTFKDYEAVEQKAMEFYRQGDFRQGLRFLYIALLLKFNEENLIRIDKSKTNRQYLNELLNYGFAMYDVILDFTRTFNECWYGGRRVEKEKFDLWYETYGSLIKAVHV